MSGMEERIEVSLGNFDVETRRKSELDFVGFWEEEAKKLNWFKKWGSALEWKPPFAKWFVGGKINASYNALDIHQAQKDQKTAILWEGEDGKSRDISYEELWIQVQKFANVLKERGVRKGDRVTIYLPMLPELPIAMLACARLGAIHTVVFSGFSASSLRDRIEDSKSKVVITADGGYRRGSVIELKKIVDDAIQDFNFVENVIVVKRTNQNIKMNKIDQFWDALMNDASKECPAEELESTHPLYILYTSGTTGKPKGVLHGTGGYLTHIHSTFKWAFDIKDSDIYFCTADIGWVTGHSYVVYGPLMHGATLVMYEGAPDYPDASRMWQIIQKYGVTIFYTTPTALRMFMKFGDELPNSHDLSTLRLLGSVGEPINPEVWRWYFDVVGKRRCPIIDTWWQTETGGMMITSLPGLETIMLKPGSATRPVPGVSITVVDEEGKKVPPDTKGYLVITKPWPGMLLTLWQDDEKYEKVYWSKYENCYYPGDYAKIDKDDYLWLLGRADDVLKVAGHRIGTAELESSIVSHEAVAESAVCGVPDEIKGEVIHAFVVIKEGVRSDRESLKQEIVSKVRETIGAIASPEAIYFVSKLPKTRSGKIMRRLLKSIASDEKVGDVSTLEDEAAVDEIKAAHEELKKSIN